MVMGFDNEETTKSAKKKKKILASLKKRLCHNQTHGTMLIFFLCILFGVLFGCLVTFYLAVYIEQHGAPHRVRRVRRDKGILRGPNCRTRVWPELD